MAERSDPARVPSYERQNTEDVADLPLKIPVSAIYEHFQCPICIGRIDYAAITPCGHRYCTKCIEEWVNRRHECPVCKSKLSSDELIRDHGFDAMIRDVRSERHKAEKEYYKQLVEAATNAPFSGQEAGRLVSPLETVLQKHMKQSLSLHEAYHQQLLIDYKRGLAKLGQEKHRLAEQVIREFPHDPEHPRRVAQLEEVESQWEAKKTTLGGELERVEKLLAAAYDRYLTGFIPAPVTIPVTVTLAVPERDFAARDVVIKPDETMASIVKRLRTLMEQKGMEIIEFPQCNEFEMSFISPFAVVDEDGGREEEEEGGVSCGGDAGGAGGGKEDQQMSLTCQVVHDDCRPVLEFSLKPGTELRFKGKIVLIGEIPKICYAVAFARGQAGSMDYFTCKQCSINWVCQPCSEQCHQGHELVPYVMGHKPTWACCYCPRKKLCTIQDD